MRVRAGSAGLALLLAAGCVYFNALHNADEAWSLGERARFSGDVATAQRHYETAAENAARAFRQDPDGRWAAASLVTLGKAWIRLGRWQDGRRALREATALADDSTLAREARVWIGATWVLGGNADEAIETLNLALGRGGIGTAIEAEGHMWRARVHLREGLVDQGWWDLDRATEMDPRLTVPAHLERVHWGIVAGDSARTASGVRALLDDRRGAQWADSVGRLIEGPAVSLWGPGPAAALLAPARRGPWPPGPRNGLVFLRSELLLRAGDTLAAETELGGVAAGVGEDAAEARLRLSGIRLRRVTTPAQLETVRTVLLPAVEDARVQARLEELRMLEILTRDALRSGDPAAWFAAAELARDALGAPGLARGLYLALVETAPDGPWTGKALLAALALAGSEPQADALRIVLDGRDADPYVLAARNDYVDPERLRALEESLSARTAAWLEAARAEAATR